MIAALVFFINYKPCSYLLGWDSLQTELYPSLAFKRALFSVWEEYQSLGLTAGMAHASDLVRATFVWLISFALPQNIIRYFVQLFLFLIGGLGMLKLLDFTNKDKKNNFVNFLGSLFYMLNLGTIQIFYVPFEAFSTFFAFLPWEVWIFLKTINKEQVQKRDYFLLFIINLLAVGQAYIQTLFVVYIIILVCLLIGLLIQSRSTLMIKKSLIVFFIIFLVNSFWILPQLYFLKNGGGSIVESAKINQIATGDVFYQNKEKGTLPYFIKMEGFYFDLFDKSNRQLFAPWKKYFRISLIGTLPYIFFGIALIGLIGNFKKNKYSLPFTIALIPIVVALLNNTVLIQTLNDTLRSIHFIDQIFRSPFTKFIIPYSFLFSYFFTQGILLLVPVFKRIHLFEAFICFFIFLYAFPAFQGSFFSPTMKIQIPDEYAQLINYMKTVDKNQRIALLPDYTFWGWFFTHWGYDGSGFLWYGIEQPIVSRTFDVWSDKSEGYFWEMKAATESENINEFEMVLKKYDIDYLLVDSSLLPVVSSLKGMQYDRIDKLLNESPMVSLVKKWPDLALYQVKQTNVKNFITTYQNIPNIGPKYRITNDDRAYLDTNGFQTDQSGLYDEYYPFSELMSQTRISNKNWTISEDQSNFIVKVNLQINPQDYNIVVPTTQNQAILNINGNITYLTSSLITDITDKLLTVYIPKILVKNFDPKLTAITKCASKTTCFGYNAPFLDQNYGYLISINNTNLSGRRLFFYLLDETKDQSYIEDRLIKNLEYYIVPPKYKYGLGYSLDFQNNSYNGITSLNEIKALEVYLFPYNLLKNIKFVKKGYFEIPSRSSLDFQAKKINYFTYEVTTNSSYIVLNQSFDLGWIAFANGKLLTDHVLVNNWANGWSVGSGTKKITIIFWPQYLEFIGFGLLIITFLCILKIKNN